MRFSVTYTNIFLVMDLWQDRTCGTGCRVRLSQGGVAQARSAVSGLQAWKIGLQNTDQRYVEQCIYKQVRFEVVITGAVFREHDL